MPPLATGTLAPPFHLTSMDGKPYSLPTGLKQGPVLAVFFKVACPTCQFTLPFVERLYRQLRGAAGQVWGIAQDDPQQSQKFAKQYGLTFPILIDEEPYEVSRKYALKYVPTLFLIGPDGHVEISGDGFSKADLNAMQKFLAKHLSVTPAALFEPSDHVPEYKPG